ncbi:MAG: phosphoglucomutase/phosphomannomutase family protein [Firmicutes bacterium]|nr:phosphoglucomutase/phosphomannomutase family protein [Bacillota bacterium]
MSIENHGIKFGTDGWRAIMCDTFTFANVRIVVQAIASYLLDEGKGHKGILIGYDARFLAERFAEEAAKIMIANGVKVYMMPEDAPTPVVAYAVTLCQSAGAIMFTASHNPPEYNGIKYIPEYAGPASEDITRAIEANLGHDISPQAERVDLEIARQQGKLQDINPRDEYFEHVRGLVDFAAIRTSGLKIVCDPMYASGRNYLPDILRANGCEVETIRGHRDPLFGGGLPEPTAKELASLAEKIQATGSHLGLATDGDADRFGIIDGTGKYITPNQVIALLLVHLVEHKGYTGSVIRTVATTHLLDRLAEKYGLEIYETPVGFKYICEHMRTRPVIIGGEESGGLSIGTHIPEKDGILANLLIAELQAVDGRNLSEIFADILAEVGPFYSRRIDLRYPEEKKATLVQGLISDAPQEIAGKQVVQVIDVDGAKLIFDDGSWFLVRPSGTEPLLRVYLEGSSEEAVEKLAAAVSQYVESH